MHCGVLPIKCKTYAETNYSLPSETLKFSAIKVYSFFDNVLAGTFRKRVYQLNTCFNFFLLKKKKFTFFINIGQPMLKDLYIERIFAEGKDTEIDILFHCAD